MVRPRDSVARCSVELAEIYKSLGRAETADAHLAAALQNEGDPKLRASILIDRLDLLLAANKSKKAANVFAQARRLVAQEGSKEQAVDLHMKLGDHQWVKRAHFNALQRYAVAAVESLSISGEAYSEVTGHISGRLLRMSGKNRSRRIEALQNRLSRWLVTQVSPRQLSVVSRIVLWPLKVVSQLTRRLQEGELPSDALFEEVVGAELRGLGQSAERDGLGEDVRRAKR